MKNRAKQPNKTARSENDDLLGLYMYSEDPNERRGDNRRARWDWQYRGGTEVKNETGKDHQTRRVFIPDADDKSITPKTFPDPIKKTFAQHEKKQPEQSTKRVLSHGIKKGPGTAKVSVGGGKKINGVGQETIDGYVNKTPRALVKEAAKDSKKPPRRR